MDARNRPAGCCEIAVDPTPLPVTVAGSVVDMCKALSDQTRFDIFRLVAAQPAPICACDIADRFQVSQPTISHHMKVLREAGLISVSRRGVWAYYAVEPHAVELLSTTIAAFLPQPLAATR